MRPTISAYVCTSNEESNIADCLRSVAWCDEIVVVDSLSKDRTAEIARSLGARVILNEWPGFREQAQFALRQVESDWALRLDADERVSPELEESMKTVLEGRDPEIKGYRLTRVTYHLGKFFSHGTLCKRIARLARVDSCRWAGENPHAYLAITGKVGKLDGELVHLRNRDLARQLQVYNSYSSQKADEMWARGRRAGAWSIVMRPVARFLKSYVHRQGFRLGVAGLVAAMEEASYDFYKYAKIWEKESGLGTQDPTAYASWTSGERTRSDDPTAL